MSGWILALGGSDHDPSAALMHDHEIRVAIEQERLSRRKYGTSYWYESPVQKAVDYCLAEEGISTGEIQRIVASDTLPARVRDNFPNHNIKHFAHHLCHAAAAYLMAPHGSTAGILVYDGFGSVRGPVPGDPIRNLRETFSFFLFGPDTYRCLGSTFGRGYVEPDEFPVGVTDSIGMLYELVTGILGYGLMDSGKTMGLSSYGQPRYQDFLETYVEYGDGVDNAFKCATDSQELIKGLERILFDGRGSFAVRSDLAASVQAVLNKTLVHCASFFRDYEIEYLCISGGCALNTVANSYLVDHSPFNVPLIIPPHSGDAGLAFGALWLDAFAHGRVLPKITFRGQSVKPHLARPGRTYTKEERRAAVDEFYPRLSLDPSVTSPCDLAAVLAKGEVVGVLNGRSEFGPRALGGRSILADPRSVLIRENINRVIKRREPFRPLAPMVLASDYCNYFHDNRKADSFMLKVARATERCLRVAPAVVHIDGTSRVQVVADDGDPFLVELLLAFRKQTGIGLLLNTSFNRRGEPIVESPLDAIDCFLGIGLDGLYLDGEFYRRDATSPRV